MAYYGFTRSLLAGEGIPFQGQGNGGVGHGLTYVDDIVAGILQALQLPAQPDPKARLPHVPPVRTEGVARILNIGSHDPVRLLDFVAALENAVGREAELKMMPMSADNLSAQDEAPLQRVPDLVGECRATMPLAEGVQRFVHWYLSYHGLRSDKEPSAQRRAAVFEDPMSVQIMPSVRAQRGGQRHAQSTGGAY
jgi:UDP-glucuronate 4-epimerase